MAEIQIGCRGFEADLSALLDDELAPERAAELRAHLAACSDCRAQMARLARVDLALAAALAPALPASLRARLGARLASERELADDRAHAPHGRAPGRTRRWQAGGALAATAAGVALYLALAGREPARQETAAPAPPQIARPLEDAPRALPQEVAKLPAPVPPAPPPVPAQQPAAPLLDLATVPEEELGLALEIETVEDLEVIGNLELLELVLASEAG